MFIRRQFARVKSCHLTAIVFVMTATALMCFSQPGFAADRQVAPGFTLQDLGGVQHSLAEYEGKVILINFWTTICPPCLHEMPSLDRLYNTLRDSGFVVIAINSDAAGHPVVKPVTDRLGLSFPVLLDPESKVTGLYGVRLHPTTYLIDRQGFLVSRIVGFRDWMSAEQFASIRALLPAPRQHWPGAGIQSTRKQHGQFSNLQVNP